MCDHDHSHCDSRVNVNIVFRRALIFWINVSLFLHFFEEHELNLLFSTETLCDCQFTYLFTIFPFSRCLIHNDDMTMLKFKVTNRISFWKLVLW